MERVGLILPFYILAFIAIAGNIVVLIYISRVFETFHSITTRLIILLHLSVILEGLASLPDVYAQSPGVCEVMGALHYYFGLVIIGVDLSLTLLFYNFLILNDPLIEKRLAKYGIPIILTFSLITFLPFTTGSYGTNAEEWCTLNYYDEESNIWAFAIFYAESFVAFLVCLASLAYLLHFIRKYDISTQKDILLSAGSYVLITLVGLGPRLIPRIINLFVVLSINDTAEFFVQGSIYLASICYVVCFFRNSEILRNYEFHRRNESLSRNLMSISSDLVDAFDTERARSLSGNKKSLWLEEKMPLNRQYDASTSR